MSHTPVRSIRELLESILEAVKPIKILSAVRGVGADIRVNVINAPTVTTVGTVNNQAQMG